MRPPLSNRGRLTPPFRSLPGSAGEACQGPQPSPAVEDGLLPGAQLVHLRRHRVGELDERAAEGHLAEQQDEGIRAGGREGAWADRGAPTPSHPYASRAPN